MVYRAAGFEADNTDPGFSDVPQSAWFYTPVATLKAWGVISGRTPTTYDPSAAVNRAEAMKIITLAFDIQASEGATVPFSDVASGDWFFTYVAAAYENSIVDGQGGTNKFDPAGPITRAAMSKLLGLSLVVADSAEGEWARANGVSAFSGLSDAELTALITGGEVVVDNGPVNPSNTSLNVTLANNTPAASNIPNNGFNVDFTHVNFAAGTAEGAKVTGLTVTRTGLGNAGNFSRVKLYVGNTQLGNEKTFSTQHNTAVFNLSSSPLMVPAGSSVTVRILGDMSSPGSGFANQLGVASAAHVEAVGANTGGAITATGNFGVFGNLQTTTGALVGTITYEVTDPHGSTATEFYIGETDRVQTRINLSTTSEDMDLSSITFRQEGSANSQDVGNFTLWQGGQVIAGPVQMNDRYVTFDLATPYFIERGNSVNLEVHGDIFGGFNRTIGLDIYRDWHIMATGRIYGYPVNVLEGAGSVTTVNDTITGTRTSFAQGSKNPTSGDIAPNARDSAVLQFNVINTGDAITVKNLPVAIRTTGAATPNQASDVKIWKLDAEGNRTMVVAGPIEPTSTIAGGTEKVIFTDEFDVAENTTGNFLITVDIDAAAPAGATFDVDVINPDGTGLGAGPFANAAGAQAAATSGFEIKNVSTNDIIFNNAAAGATHITTDVNGNIRTVNLPNLTFTVATSPATDVFVRNATNIPVVGIDVRAGSSLDTVLTALTATLTQRTAAFLGDAVVRGSTCSAVAVTANDLDRVRLYAVNNGTETLLDGPRNLTTNGTVSFTGFSHNVVAGETEKLLIRADVPSSATADICPTFRIAVNSDVSANDANGRALATVNGSLNTFAGGNQIAATDVNGTAVTTTATAYLLAASSGKLQITANNDTPAQKQVLSGTNGVEFTRLKLQANTVEDVKIERLRLFNAGSGNNAIKSVKLYVNDQQVASGTLTGGYVTWENLNVVVPKDDNIILSVRGDLNTSSQIVAIAGSMPRFVVRNLEDNWIDGGVAGAPNAIGSEATTTAGENGDVKAIGIQSGIELLNTETAVDAIAGDRGFNDAAGVSESLCDSSGNLNGTVETAPAEGDTCTVSTALTTAFTFSGTPAKAQTVLNTKLSLALASNNPTGSQGAATGSEEDIFRFTVSAAANSTSQNPRQASFNLIYLTLNGDAEASDLKLFGPSNNYTAAIATAQAGVAAAGYQHNTNNGGVGDGAAASEHSSRTSVAVFDLRGSTDSLIDYGQSKTFLVKAKTYAVTDNDKPTRSLRPSIENYGTATGGLADVQWDDNGLAFDTTGAAVTANSVQQFWIDDDSGKTKLQPSTPLSYTGTSFVNGGLDTVVPALTWARTISATQVQVFASEPLILATPAAGDFLLDFGPGAVADTAAPTINGNVITIVNTTPTWGLAGAGILTGNDIVTLDYSAAGSVITDTADTPNALVDGADPNLTNAQAVAGF
jgi:hypothetical protein